MILVTAVSMLLVIRVMIKVVAFVVEVLLTIVKMSKAFVAVMIVLFNLQEARGQLLRGQPP